MAVDHPGALPVTVDVDGRLHGELVAFVEGSLGWQVTRGDDLPPALALVGAGAVAPANLPALLLVRDDDPPMEVARVAAGAAGVLRWPDDRGRLVTEAARVAAGSASDAGDVVTLRIGGSSGGVGTTTVALALGGLVAWAGRPVLVLVSGDVPVPDVPLVDPTALGAHRTWDAAAVVPGASDLRALAVLPGPRAAVHAPSRTVVLRDDGVSADVDLLVCVRDRAGTEALGQTIASVAVVVDRGVVPPDRWARVTRDGPRQILLPFSTRVARAGARRQVPGSLPGRWLTALEPLARSLR